MDVGNINAKIDLAPGRWVDDIPGAGEVRLKVRSASFKPYRVAYEGLQRRFAKKLNTTDGRAAFEIEDGRLMAEYIILDWDGITNGGKPVSFSKAKATEYLTADDDAGIGREFRRLVNIAMEYVADGVRTTAQEAAGN